MKIRDGFVSNSSSSSFVVARPVIGDERFFKLLELLNEYESDENRERYSDDFYFENNDNYIHINASYHDEGINEIIWNKMKFDKGEYLSVNE